MDNYLHEFTRISIFSMCEHYLPKLKIILDGVDKEVLWKHEKETLQSGVLCYMWDNTFKGTLSDIQMVGRSRVE